MAEQGVLRINPTETTIKLHKQNQLFRTLDSNKLIATPGALKKEAALFHQESIFFLPINKTPFPSWAEAVGMATCVLGRTCWCQGEKYGPCSQKLVVTNFDPFGDSLRTGSKADF